jgi:hypothetical protein
MRIPWGRQRAKWSGGRGLAARPGRDSRRRCGAERRSRRRRSVALVVLAVLAAGAVTVAALTGYLLVGAGAVMLSTLAWVAYAWRRSRAAAGPGNGPAPPGGAGVREPRRPLPFAPAGAAELPRSA